MSFTDQEKELIHHYARRESANEELLHTITILLPIIAFGIYGIYKKDIMLISMSWSGFLLYTIWNTSLIWRYFPIYKSLLDKLVKNSNETNNSNN